MPLHLSPAPIFQFNIGAIPAAGYQLFTYVAGTTIPVVTYKDAIGTPNTNPILLDGNGACQIWLTDGLSYKYYLSTPSDTNPPSLAAIFETDDISSPSGATPAYSVHVVTTNTLVTVAFNNAVILADATAGNIVLTLPDAAVAGEGFIVTIKKTDSSSNTVTLQPVGGQTIDTTSSAAISVQFHVRQIISDGTNWQTIIRPIPPTGSKYLLQTSDINLPNAQALGSLATGFVQNTTTTGIQQTRINTGTANEITVTNGDGSSGNPTYGLPSALTFTGKTITGGTFTGSGITPSSLTVIDNTFTIEANGDNTKQVQFAVSNVATGTLRTKTLQNVSGTIYETGGQKITLSDGGTNAAISPSNGGLVYSTSTALAVIGGTATANQIPLSGSSSAPSWSTATYPGTTTINQLLYSSAGNVIAGLPTANSSVLLTSAGGVPSLGTTLPPVTLTTPALGTPTAGVLTSCTGLPISTGVSGLAAGVATFLATPSSANLATAMTDKTGTGVNVFATSPTLVTPLLGTPTSGTLTNCTGLPVAGGGTGVATTTAYGVIHGGTTATGAFQNSGTPGASGTLYQSAGATSMPTWVTASGVGAFQKITTLTASSSASLSYTTMTSTYSAYMFLFRALNPATTATNLLCTLAPASGVFLSAGYTYAYNVLIATTAVLATNTPSGSDSATSIILCPSVLAAAAGDGTVNGWMYFVNPAMNQNPECNWSIVSYNTSITTPTWGLNTGGGSNATQQITTQIKFAMSSGNIADGSIEIYGMLS